MNENEIKEYLNRKDDLLLKLSGNDKDTLEWILFGYNECARLLMEKERENKNLKDEIYKSNAVADTNIELAESYYKEIERLKGLLKCDYEDGQTIIAELTTENKQLKENNLAMQEEMTRTWAKLQQKDNIINKANKKIEKMFEIGDENKVIDDLLEIQKILDNKGE